ncbi:MAG TPA: metal ABC transporter ATP-binding protein [Ilumatobacter sp.]|nr:metal ABC transporter ATP-binding protein [Ilumatobacter sp.]
MPLTAPVVRLADVAYGYAGATAVRAALAIEPGEVVAVLGPNGSGKSTLVKGMLGLVDCYGGATEWFGRPDGSLRERWRVGYVPQRQPGLTPVPVTVTEMVRSGRVARVGVFGRHRGADRAAVAAAIDTVGLSHRRTTPVGDLSGGQQRRVLVARALASEAEVLVLDEPFAGVDAENQDALATTFTTLATRGVTLIVVLHELGALAPLITREVCLVGGTVDYDGPPSAHPADHVHDHHDDPHCDDLVDVRADGPSIGLLAQ